MFVQQLPSAQRAFQYAKRVGDRGTDDPQHAGHRQELPAGADYVIDQDNPATLDVRALDLALAAVVLGLASQERSGETGGRRQGDDQRNAAELDARQDLSVVGDQGGHRLGDVVQEARVGGQPVLVEVRIQATAVGQGERTGNAGRFGEPGRQRGGTHRGCGHASPSGVGASLASSVAKTAAEAIGVRNPSGRVADSNSHFSRRRKTSRRRAVGPTSHTGTGRMLPA